MNDKQHINSIHTKNRVTSFDTVLGMGCQGVTGREKDRATTDDLLTRPCKLHEKITILPDAKTVKIRQMKTLFRCELHPLTGKIDHSLSFLLIKK